MTKRFEGALRVGAFLLAALVLGSAQLCLAAQHGPNFPPDPWEKVAVQHGPNFPPEPWEKVAVQHGPNFPPDPWEKIA